MRKSIRAFILFIRGRFKKPNPIQWKCTAQKTNTNTYRIHVTAFISDPWRLYSWESEWEGPMPTLIEFEEHSLIHILGEPKEMGTFKEAYDPKSDVRMRYYTTVANFVQEVRAHIQPLWVKGKVIFTACTEKRCLEPKEIEFQVELN